MEHSFHHQPSGPFAPPPGHDGDQPHPRQRGFVPRHAPWVVAIAICCALAIAWRFTGLSAWLDAGELAARLESVRHTPWAPLLVVTGFVAGSLVMFPVTVMIIATVLVFGAWPGIAYAMAGILLASVIGHRVGRRMGERRVLEIAGTRAERLRSPLRRKTVVLAVGVVRVVPIAPFSVVNLACGAIGVPLPKFLAGTAIGMAPGLLALAILSGQVAQSLSNPAWSTVVAPAAMAALLALAVGLPMRGGAEEF